MAFNCRLLFSVQNDERREQPTHWRCISGWRAKRSSNGHGHQSQSVEDLWDFLRIILFKTPNHPFFFIYQKCLIVIFECYLILDVFLCQIMLHTDHLTYEFCEMCQALSMNSIVNVSYYLILCTNTGPVLNQFNEVEHFIFKKTHK